ncbi:hypothetical protein BDW02DRAFT_577703 [Decorospora gaudefroyi]|uniref:Extracellular membrane protein CFEM domain-containing protein n=1 Tax=Decorospora gaudefroyi TaxID=184978 RepID=A0A6A5KLH7_9PLEO|nr:hypothetical protein BDW02DRAFT_577703 [Decorospora gaudefroyi]
MRLFHQVGLLGLWAGGLAAAFPTGAFQLPSVPGVPDVPCKPKCQRTLDVWRNCFCKDYCRDGRLGIEFHSQYKVCCATKLARSDVIEGSDTIDGSNANNEVNATAVSESKVIEDSDFTVPHDANEVLDALEDSQAIEVSAMDETIASAISGSNNDASDVDVPNPKANIDSTSDGTINLTSDDTINLTPEDTINPTPAFSSLAASKREMTPCKEKCRRQGVDLENCMHNMNCASGPLNRELQRAYDMCCRGPN